MNFVYRQAVPVSVSEKGPIFAIMSRLNNVKIVLKYCQPWKTAYNKWKKVPRDFMHLLLIPLVRNLFSFVSEVSIWRTFMHSRQTFILCFWIKATVSQRWWYMEPFFICHFSRLDSIPTLSWQYWALTLSGTARLKCLCFFTLICYWKWHEKCHPWKYIFGFSGNMYSNFSCCF